MAGGSVTCAGKQYQGPYTQDVTNAPGVTLLGIRGWGYAVLRSVHTVGIYQDGGHGPPTCTENTGNYSMVFTRGFVGQVKTGTYVARADGSLTLS